MDAKTIVVEICGAPYAGKSHVWNALVSELRERFGPATVASIDEYRGEDSRFFYESAKFSSDLNIARCCHCLEQLLHIRYRREVNFVVIDRGFIDSLAWIFALDQGDHTRARRDSHLIWAMLDLLQIQAFDYRVLYFHCAPITSAARHGLPGRIINDAFLRRLQRAHESTLLAMASRTDEQSQDQPTFESSAGHKQSTKT